MNTIQRKQAILDLHNKRYTYQDIGNIFGISRQRVHQIITGYVRPSELKRKKEFTKIPENWKPKNEINKIGLGYLSGTDYLSEIVRRRDNHTCQICGKIWKEGKRRFDVHHLDEENESKHTYENYKCFNRMITLCHCCHMNLPHIREKVGNKTIKKIFTPHKNITY